jgi:hypothetical protein
MNEAIFFAFNFWLWIGDELEISKNSLPKTRNKRQSVNLFNHWKLTKSGYYSLSHAKTRLVSVLD